MGTDFVLTLFTGEGRRTANLRFGARRCILVLSVTVVLVCGACSSNDRPDAGASAVVSSLGAVPIPSAVATDPTPTASARRAQVLAMGAPVDVILADGGQAIATATGPDQVITVPTAAAGGVEQSTPATITLTITATRGTVDLAVTDLICRDDTGSVISLSPEGAPSTTVGAGATGTVKVSGVFRSGAAQITWQPGGHAIALWDFNIELD